MTGIVLSPDQVRSAPPAVRRWIDAQLAGEFGAAHSGLPGREAEPAGELLSRLTLATLSEVLEIFRLLQRDPPAEVVFVQLGREPIEPLHPSEIYAIDAADIARKAGITKHAQLIACLNHVNAALQSLRGDPEAALVLCDQAGRCFIREATHRAIHVLWDDLHAAPTPARWPAHAKTLGLPLD